MLRLAPQPGSTPGSTPVVHPYPLYEHLLERVQAHQGSEVDVKRMCDTISSLSRKMSTTESVKHNKEILALILHHHRLQGGAPGTLPFGGKVMAGGKGALYNTQYLPVLLQQILAEYLDFAAQQN